MREKLIELLSEHCAYKEKRCVGCDKDGKYYHPECRTNLFGKIADHLIANGVTIPVWCGECWAYNQPDCPMSGSPGKVSVSDFCSYGERKDNA